AVTQLGTMAAVLWFFRADLARIVRAWLAGLGDPRARRSLDSRLGWYIGLGTVPIALAGFAFRDQIEHAARALHLIAAAPISLERAARPLPLLAAAPIVLGLVLAAADRLGSHRRGIDDLRARDGAAIGLAQ